jgi:Flp pilus assembly pilin Flp
MNFKKYLERFTKRQGQSALEYAILVAIAIVALIGVRHTFIENLSGGRGALEEHFQRTATVIYPQVY